LARGGLPGYYHLNLEEGQLWWGELALLDFFH